MDHARFQEQALEHLRVLTSAHAGSWGLGTSETWEADVGAGRIWWTFPDKIVEADMQIVATYNLDDGTLMWGWDHPSVPSEHAGHARLLKAHGEKHRLTQLTTRLLQCSEHDAWLYTAMAVKLADAQGAYRGPAGHTMVFMTFGEVTIRRRDA